MKSYKILYSKINKITANNIMFNKTNIIKENKNNQMIIKSNLRNKYSKIHVGSNVWENFLDQHIYPKMMSVISETMIEYINMDNKKKNNKIKQLDDYLQIMASDGYSNSETLEYKKKYKNNIDMLKILFNSFM